MNANGRGIPVALTESSSTSKEVTTGSEQVILTRATNNFGLDVARGLYGNISNVHKFGFRASVGTTQTVIWGGTATSYPFPTTDTKIRVAAGGNAADVATTGAGAWTVTVQGLDANWAVQEETLTLAGASASADSTNTFIRVFRAFVASCGTYGGNNTGDISIESTGGSELITIKAGEGQSQTTVYTIPAGKMAYLTAYSADVNGKQSATVAIYQRRNADDVSSPYSAKRLLTKIPGLTGNSNKQFTSIISFPEKTDIWSEAATGLSSSDVNCNYDLYLVDNGS